MRALVLTDSGPRLTAGYPEPVLAAGDALVRVRLAGICGTDLELVAGYASFRGVLGHEFVGVVEAGDEASWLGARVVAEINLSADPERAHAPDRAVLGIRGRDGCFADLVAVPTANLHRVSDALGDEEAVFCEPVAAACRVLEQIDGLAIRDAAVLGPGRLGLLCAQVLRRRVFRPVVLGRSLKSLELPRRLGFAVGLAAEQEPDGFDLVVDATGSPPGLAEAIRLCRPLGTVILKSTCAAPAELDASAIAVKELRVQGSRCGPFATALELLATGEVDPLPLVDAVYPLERAEQALREAARPGVRKVLLRP